MTRPLPSGTVRKDSDAAAALAKLKAYVVRIRLYHKAQDYTTIDDDEALEIIAGLEESSPTKTLKQVALEIEALRKAAEQKEDELWAAQGKSYVKVDAVARAAKYTQGMKEAYKIVLAILTTSTDETDGRTG